MSNLKVQENEKPYEEPNSLLVEMMKLNDELCSLIKKINKRNNEVLLASGETILDALADREMLLKKRQLLSAIAVNAGQYDFRFTHAEIKVYTALISGKFRRKLTPFRSSSGRLIHKFRHKTGWLI